MRTLTIHPGDNVAVVLEEGGAIPRGHKLALSDIAAGENIIKYGAAIGHAAEDIRAGGHVHVHNCKTNLSGVLEYAYEPVPIAAPEKKSGTFMGYVRADGSVGIRNEIWIVNTVGCVNKSAERLAREANIRFAGETDGVFAFSHPYGCSQIGGDLRRTQDTLKGLARHPNAAGVLVLGLGCEENNIPAFQRILGSWDSDRVKFLSAQDVPDEIEAGLAVIGELVAYAKTFKRRPVDIARLTIGLKCGGSDGLSGITANPLVGRISDELVSYGGTTILSEVPEMFGAETLLMNRCPTEGLFGETVRLINDFKEYYIRHGQQIYENPSPGNKQGGITTLEDKSLGCTQKGGTSPVRAVLHDSLAPTVPGLNLLRGPGNDIVAVTEMTAAGAHIILFTTGRGTPVGAPVPTVKIASNTALWAAKPNWIDFDAGRLIGGMKMDELAAGFWQYVLAVASGEQATRNEQNGYREIAIFKDGVTL